MQIKRNLLLISIISIFNCFNNPSFDDFNELANSVNSTGTPTGSPVEPKKYCVKLDTIRTSGTFSGNPLNDYEPRLYGRICAVSSEDPNLLRDDIDLEQMLSGCKNLWFVQDDAPFAAAWIVSAAGFVTDIFDDQDLQDIQAMYTDAASNPATIIRETDHLQNTVAEISLQDYLNNRLLIVFLPIIKDDNLTDDILADTEQLNGTDVDGTEHYPIIIQTLNSELPTGGGEVTKTKILKHQGRTGTVQYKFKINRGECSGGFILP